MGEKPRKNDLPLKSLPSLLDLNPRLKEGRERDEAADLFYTCPQCGHAMVAKKCKIVCYHCHYFIGCVE